MTWIQGNQAAGQHWSQSAALCTIQVVSVMKRSIVLARCTQLCWGEGFL